MLLHVTRKNKDGPRGELDHKVTDVLSCGLLHGSILEIASSHSNGTLASASTNTVNKAEQNERESYVEAQKGKCLLRFL